MMNNNIYLEDTDFVLFIRTLLEERNDLRDEIISLRKEVNKKDKLLQKHLCKIEQHITYEDLYSDILMDYYDNPIIQKYFDIFKDSMDL